MTEEHKPIAIDGPMLVAAFPVEKRSAAMRAGTNTARLLVPEQALKRFAIHVEGQTILIPERLHFASHQLTLLETSEAWLFARALQTRSSDGFERQRAARDLLRGFRPWAATFVLALVGEYVIEILDDLSAAMTPELEETLGVLIKDNRALWGTIQRRVTSYGTAHHRSRWGNEGAWAYLKDEYVGFTLVKRLDRAASARARAAGV